MRPISLPVDPFLLPWYSGWQKYPNTEEADHPYRQAGENT